MVLAKYKCLTDDIAREKRTSKSQRQSIAYLIQAVIFLSRRVKNTSDQWHKTQIQLQAIQTDYSRLRKQTRKIMAVCCVLVILNVCRIPPVKQRIIKIVKLFGFVENVRKINRMRKMVAENWRNIPSLLTDFWRIFIFRSTTKLKNS
ncbi:uncharacterized protein LOC132759234 [Ruditapes philippinarum]|uniref:uncharacterized protein LOC132759234 n=1 Tax=Ruditapes philippinarum TaxID=129788 RepID=UPI00295B1A5D|nr:uncharacterized protein LOC132759234 [Ruditapes philippinarum]